MKKNNLAILGITAVSLILGTLLLINVLLLDVKGVHAYSGLELRNYNGISYVEDERISAARGNIYDRNGYLLATDAEAWDIVAYVSPTRPGNKNGVYYVDDKEGTAEKLAEVLGADKDELLALLNRDVFMTYLGEKGRTLSKEKKEEIEALNLNGIEFIRVTTRYYPFSPFSSHLIGFGKYMRTDDGGNNSIEGQTGIEASLNEYLKGTDGKQSYYRDTAGNVIVGQQTDYVSAIDGNDVYLTLDKRIQDSLQDCLEKSLKSGSNASLGWGMVMEAKTGRILAYDTYPTYNQNSIDVESYLDYCSMVSYEPGSVMKTFTWAIGLDANPDFKLENTFNGNTYYLGSDGNGNIKRVASPSSPGYVSTIWNFAKWQYGETNYWDAFRLSINSGALSILEQYLTTEVYVDYLHKFNFFKPVNVFGIENEAEGIENLEHIYDLGPSTFGQACGYTALQVMQGYTAFCNDGYMVKPYIVDKIVNRYTGETVYQGETEIVGHPIKAETAKLVQALMKQTETSYANPNLSVGGKTGTAQVAENGVYSSQWVHSIVLTMPADDPKILVYVCYQDYSSYGHNQPFVQDLEQTIAEQYNMSTTNLNPENPDKQIFENAMPNLRNHSLDYVYRKLGACQANITFIGTGPTVIDQYPQEGSTIITGQNVMLLLNRDNITMPDMRGWSRKEVTAFWELTGIEITLDGSGYVTEQSIDVGENIGVGSEIYVKLE